MAVWYAWLFNKNNRKKDGAGMNGEGKMEGKGREGRRMELIFGFDLRSITFFFYFFFEHGCARIDESPRFIKIEEKEKSLFFREGRSCKKGG